MRQILLGLLFITTPVLGSSFSEKVTWVTSTEGFDRQVTTTAEASNETLRFQLQYVQSVSDSLTQTLVILPNPYTEVKALYSTGENQKTIGTGISHWITDQVQMGLDLSRTEQESELILNSEFDTIETASNIIGTSVFLKQLINPTTIATYSILGTRADSERRYFGSVQLKHFLKKQDLAIAGLLGSGVGSDLHSYEGWVWIGKMLGDAEYSVKYRAYVEKAEFLYGSDAVELGAAYRLDTWLFKASGGQYLSNRKFKANLYSLEVIKEF